MTRDYRLQARMNAEWIKIPSYRLYVDDELICERTFWPDPTQFVIEETAVVELAEGEHTVIIEQVDPTMGRIWMDRFRVTDVESDHTRLDMGCDAHGSKRQVLKFRL